MKKILKNILIFVSYFFYNITFKTILFFFNINYNSFNINQKIIYTVVTGIIYLLILVLLYKKELKEELKDFKINHRKYLSKNVLIYILGVLLMGLTNVILNAITKHNLSTNESLIREYIDKYPLYMAFSTVIFAPISEELIFRKSIKNIFKNKYLFIIISGLIFGILHIQNFGDINDILFSIAYIIMGIDFAYIYSRTNNIFTTMTFHICHNLILFIIQLLL